MEWCSYSLETREGRESLTHRVNKGHALGDVDS